jgi:hypothetical protein
MRNLIGKHGSDSFCFENPNSSSSDSLVDENSEDFEVIVESRMKTSTS